MSMSLHPADEARERARIAKKYHRFPADIEWVRVIDWVTGEIHVKIGGLGVITDVLEPAEEEKPVPAPVTDPAPAPLSYALGPDLFARALAALDGTTPGPWRVTEEIDGIRAGRPTVVCAGDPEACGTLRVVTVDQTRPHFGATRSTKGQDEANAAFIAAARTLVPELVARIQELEDKLRIDCDAAINAEGAVRDYERGVR